MYIEQMFEKLILTMENLDATMKTLIADQSTSSIVSLPVEVKEEKSVKKARKSKKVVEEVKEEVSTTLAAMKGLFLIEIKKCDDGSVSLEKYLKENYDHHYIEDVDPKHYSQITKELTDSSWKDKLGTLQPKTPKQMENENENTNTIKPESKEVETNSEVVEVEQEAVIIPETVELAVLSTAYKTMKDKLGDIKSIVASILGEFDATNFKTLKESDRAEVLTRINAIVMPESSTDELSEGDVKAACREASQRVGKDKVKTLMLSEYDANLAKDIKPEDRASFVSSLKNL